MEKEKNEKAKTQEKTEQKMMQTWFVSSIQSTPIHLWALQSAILSLFKLTKNDSLFKHMLQSFTGVYNQWLLNTHVTILFIWRLTLFIMFCRLRNDWHSYIESFKHFIVIMQYLAASAISSANALLILTKDAKIIYFTNIMLRPPLFYQSLLWG